MGRRGRAQALHPEVARLVRREGGRFGTEDPEQLVVLYCRELVRALIAGTHLPGVQWPGPPFCVRMLASLLGHRLEERSDLHSDDAELHPDPARPGFRIIRYNPARPASRQNFSIAHEITHTIFEPGPQRVCRREVPADEPGQFLETLCDVGASELLMPYDAFCRDYAAVGFTVDGVEQLANQYGASREAIANRMVKINNRRCAVAIFSLRRKPAELKDRNQGFLFEECRPDAKLRVDYSVCGNGFPHIPKNKSLPDDSPLYRSHRWGSDFSGELTVFAGGRERQVAGEAMFLRGGDGPDRLLVLMESEGDR